MSARVRAVQERRRSNAAGPHEDRRTRAEAFAAALADEVRSDGPDDGDER